MLCLNRWINEIKIINGRIHTIHKKPELTTPKKYVDVIWPCAPYRRTSTLNSCNFVELTIKYTRSMNAAAVGAAAAAATDGVCAFADAQCSVVGILTYTIVCGLNWFSLPSQPFTYRHRLFLLFILLFVLVFRFHVVVITFLLYSFQLIWFLTFEPIVSFFFFLFSFHNLKKFFSADSRLNTKITMEINRIWFCLIVKWLALESI